MAAIQTYRSHLYGQNTEQGTSVDHHSFSWVTRDSPTSEIIDPSNTGTPDKHSLLVWDNGHHYATKEVWIAWMLRPRKNFGTLGRLLNFHSTPALAGGWDWAGGVSSMAFDFYDSVQTDDKDTSKHYEGLTFVAEPTGSSVEGLQGSPHQYHWTVVTLAQWEAAKAASAWISLLIKIIPGNVNLGTSGAITVYKDGSDITVLNVSGINTIFDLDYRPESPPIFGQNPGGGQRGASLWTGAYKTGSDAFPTSEFSSYDFTIPRCGATVDECLSDGVDWPITEFTHTNQNSSSYSNAGSSFTEVLPAIDTSLFQVPSSLGTGTPVTPPPASLTAPSVSNWFGKQTTGSTPSTSMTVDARRGSVWQATETLDLTDIYAIVKGLTSASDSGQIRAVLYDTTGSPGVGSLAPGNKIAESASVTFSGNVARAWQQFTFLSSVRVFVGNYYVLVFHAGGIACLGIEYDPQGSPFYFKAGDVYADDADTVFGTPDAIDTRALAAFAAGAPPVLSSDRIVGLVRTGGLRVVSPASRITGGTGGGL